MREIVVNGTTYILYDDVPYKEQIEKVVEPELLELTQAEQKQLCVKSKAVHVFDSSRLKYAAIVVYLKTVNTAIKDASEDSTTILKQMTTLIQSMPNSTQSNTPDYHNQESSLLKLVYFLTLATIKGSDIARVLLDSIDDYSDELAQKTLFENEDRLNTMFNEYTGFGNPVCAEILTAIPNLIAFVQNSSKGI